ncbi:MAG: hypothetical protein SOZ65_00720 [Erysipelotrichaceae bacterium]|nr:hypothetical protein [Erysipelotrichaceae bacterium]
MKALIACIRKDIFEFLRQKKNIVCTIVLIGLGTMVLSVTNIFPTLLTQLSIKSPKLISDPTAMNGMFAKMFPSDIRGSLGILSSDIGVFYTIVVVLMCHSLLPSEIQKGKWIMPINSGINVSKLVASKCLVYSTGMAFPVVVVINLYYYTASYFLINNIKWSNVLINSFVLGIAIASIVSITIITSLIYKHSIVAALSVIIVVSTAPDILTMFSFGKWFPTYLLTFVYNSESNLALLMVPTLIMIVIIIVLYFISVKKCQLIELTR